MSKLQLLILASVCVGLPATANCQSGKQVPKKPIQSMPPAQQRQALIGGFRAIDRNHDGFVELREAPQAKQVTRKDSKLVDTRSSSVLWVNGYDRNADGKVSQAEYVTVTMERLKRMAEGRPCLDDNCKAAKAKKK